MSLEDTNIMTAVPVFYFFPFPFDRAALPTLYLGKTIEALRLLFTLFFSILPFEGFELLALDTP